MDIKEFLAQDKVIIDSIFQGLYIHLKENHWVIVNEKVYVGDNEWLLENNGETGLVYVYYDDAENSLDYAWIKPAGSYKIPTKPKHANAFADFVDAHAEWCKSLKPKVSPEELEQIKKIMENEKPTEEKE